jgi:hypothetical protein
MQRILRGHRTLRVSNPLPVFRSHQVPRVRSMAGDNTPAPKPSLPAEYERPLVWVHKELGGAMGAINLPTAGARSETKLPIGVHPIQASPIQLLELRTDGAVRVGSGMADALTGWSGGACKCSSTALALPTASRYTTRSWGSCSTQETEGEPEVQRGCQLLVPYVCRCCGGLHLFGVLVVRA